MTTNNNISIGDHATVGVAGTNNGSVSQQFSNTYPQTRKLKFLKSYKKLLTPYRKKKISLRKYLKIFAQASKKQSLNFLLLLKMSLTNLPILLRKRLLTSLNPISEILLVLVSQLSYQGYSQYFSNLPQSVQYLVF